MTGAGVVTVCIPAYQAAGFIDRTLRCAREQTSDALHILVSIDVSDDDTEERCRAHAREDDRIDVHVHSDRMGWLGNVNFALDTVRSEFAFIYFHDDVIDPTYCEQLTGALRDRPDAASSHCDVMLDGPSGERLRRGCTYDGPAAQRLLNHFVNPDRGALLRSMIRRASPAGRLRMPIQATAFEMRLVAAGPAVRIAEPLYRRFDQRSGGLTDGWSRLPFDHLLEGVRYNATMAQEVIDELQPTPEERELLDLGLAIYTTKRLRAIEATYDAPVLTPLDAVLGRPIELRLPASVEALPDDLAELCRKGLRRARNLTAKRADLLAERGSS